MLVQLKITQDVIDKDCHSADRCAVAESINAILTYPYFVYTCHGSSLICSRLFYTDVKLNHSPDLRSWIKNYDDSKYHNNQYPVKPAEFIIDIPYKYLQQ